MSRACRGVVGTLGRIENRPLNVCCRTAVGLTSLVALGSIGVVVGSAEGAWMSVAPVVLSARKGFENMFLGRKTPNTKIIYLAIKRTYSYYEWSSAASNASFREALARLRKGKKLLDDGKLALATELRKGDRIDQVARELGATDRNLEQAKDFIKDELGVTEKIWDNARRHLMKYPIFEDLPHIEHLTKNERVEHKGLFKRLADMVDDGNEPYCAIGCIDFSENSKRFIAVQLEGDNGEHACYQFYNYDELDAWIGTPGAERIDPVTRSVLPDSIEGLREKMVVIAGINLEDYGSKKANLDTVKSNDSQSDVS